MTGPVTTELMRMFPGSRVRLFHRGSAGLYHLFRALAEVRGTGEVVVPNLCCETVALAARYAGHRVRFAEVDANGLCITPRSLRDAIGPLTRAVVVVHLFGLTVDASEFASLREANPQVTFIEDVAHAAGGSDRRGREVGSGFDHAMFSFSDSKILGGEGGAIVSHRDDEVASRLHAEASNNASETSFDPLLALSLRNLVHAVADLHRAGSKDPGADIAPAMWDRYRPIIAGGGSFAGAERAAADLRDRESIRNRRRLRAGWYGDAIRHSGFQLPGWQPGETCWRYPLLAETPALRRRATDALRGGGLHASNHYFPLSRLFPGDELPESESVGDRILNLWADDSVSERNVEAAARILNSL